MSNFLKEEKRQGLLDAASGLFMAKGLFATTIGEIAAKARMAKGSFYLYYKDKEDIFLAVAERFSSRVLADAYQYVQLHRAENFEDNVILFADFIIEYFKKDPAALRMLDRKFGWPLMREALDQSGNTVMTRMMADVRKSPVLRGKSEDEIRRIIFVLVEMVGATCYSSILQNQPSDIDSMKPVLYGIIRASLKSIEEQN